MYGYVFLFLNLFGSCINLIEVLKKYNEWGKRDNCYCKNEKKKYEKYLMWKCYGNDGILCVIVMLLR